MPRTLTSSRKARRLIHAPPPTVACDIDGVLFPYMDAMRDALSETTGRELPIATEYELTEAWNVDVSDWHDAHVRLFADAASHDRLPIPGSVDEITALLDAGVKVDYVTRRAHFTASLTGDLDNARSVTVEWIKRWFPSDKWTGIFCVENKLAYQGQSSLMIDDNPAEVAQLRADGRRVLVLDQPYNHLVDGPRYRWGDNKLLSMLPPVK